MVVCGWPGRQVSSAKIRHFLCLEKIPEIPFRRHPGDDRKQNWNKILKPTQRMELKAWFHWFHIISSHFWNNSQKIRQNFFLIFFYFSFLQFLRRYFDINLFWYYKYITVEVKEEEAGEAAHYLHKRKSFSFLQCISFFSFDFLIYNIMWNAMAGVAGLGLGWLADKTDYNIHLISVKAFFFCGQRKLLVEGNMRVWVTFGAWTLLMEKLANSMIDNH